MGSAASILEENEKKQQNTSIDISTNQTVSSSPSNNKNKITSDVLFKHEPSIYIVSLGKSNQNIIHLNDLFKLRISYESLDFLHLDNEKPIVQFPFQNILCWGSSKTNFQFKIYDYNNHIPELNEQGILMR